MSINLRYKDVAIGADENATVTTSSKTAFSDVSRIPYGVIAPAVATCELNGWGLTHDYVARENQPFAFWSSTLSGDDCKFTTAPTITLDFTEQYTTTGLTIQFALNSNDYCSKLKVYWYQDGILKEQSEFKPNSAFFVLNKTVEAFDKLVFEFQETSLPRKRCKVEGIIMGVIRDFTTKELKEVKAIHEIDLISNTLPTKVLDASIHSTDEVDYIFQKKQPVEATDNGALIGVYYIEKGERTGWLDYKFSCSDAIALLDLTTYTGGLWLEETALTTVLSEVFGNALIFDIDKAFTNSKIKGFIPPDITHREALRQIAFSLGAVVETTGANKIHLFPSPVGNAEAISSKETYTGGKVTTSDTVTEVTVTAYAISDERPDNEDTSIEFNGIKYKYYTVTKHAYNPNTVTSDPENVKKFDKCYLCNLSNSQALADNIMAYYQKRDKYSFKHVLKGQKTAGRYSAFLPWELSVKGNITKMTVTTSNITVSDTEMLLDE